MVGNRKGEPYMGLLIRLVLNALSLWLTVSVGRALGLELGLTGAAGAVISVIMLALINATLGLVIRMVTMPLRCLTLGLLTVVINALLFWLAGSLDTGLYVGNFTAGLFGSIVYSLCSGIASQLVPDTEKD